MALVAYLDWEVRTTGHDLNCSGFNPNRDTTYGVDYTQQDSAEITSLNWVVDSSSNTRIRSTALTDWVNSGGTLASLKGNHIHIAGKAIGGNTLFQWVASTAVSGAYYLQALGGGNPNWTTKPTRFWMNKVFVLENTSLPSGTDSWTYGDKDSLGYSTIYVRFGAESDANPNSKVQDDIIADGRKFSGNAFYFAGTSAYHHGTILVSSDFGKLSRYLQVSKEKIVSKGVASVRSRVVNLSELSPSVTVDAVADALIKAFAGVYGCRPVISDGSEEIDTEAVNKLYGKYASWEWRYGQTPGFDITLETRFPWGGIEIGLNLKSGKVISSKVYSDAMDEAFIGKLPDVLAGCPFSFRNLADRIRDNFMSGSSREMAEDIAAWLEAKAGRNPD